MKYRLKPLFCYVKEVYEEYSDELKALSNNQQRINFLLNTVENDLTSLKMHKNLLYSMSEKELFAGSRAGTSISNVLS